VLEQVYEEIGRGASLDLDQLWQKLGVRGGRDGVSFVAAPLDFVRQGILDRP